MDIVKPNTVWQVKKAIYGLREAPRLWQKERDQKLRELEFKYNDKPAHLVQSHIHPSLWFIAEDPVAAHKRVCQYLHHTLGYALQYVPTPPQSKNKLWVLGDASFAPTGEKSQQGLIVYHGITSHQRKGDNLVQWRSSRQDLIAKSTCKAELIASSEALQQGENIAIVVAEVIKKCCDIEVSSDNAASLHMIRNGLETAWRTRHINVKALWLHQMARRRIKFTYQPTSEMAADSLLKGLGASRLPQLREDLCLIED